MVCRTCSQTSDPVPVRSSSALVEAQQQARLDAFRREHTVHDVIGKAA
jgi:hypothetical protein